MPFAQQDVYRRQNRTYDEAPDGRFLMIKVGATINDGAASTAENTVVFNWTDELQHLVPTP